MYSAIELQMFVRYSNGIYAFKDVWYDYIILTMYYYTYICVYTCKVVIAV